jgi:hypothetical protein
MFCILVLFLCNVAHGILRIRVLFFLFSLHTVSSCRRVHLVRVPYPLPLEPAPTHPSVDMGFNPEGIVAFHDGIAGLCCVSQRADSDAVSYS